MDYSINNIGTVRGSSIRSLILSWFCAAAAFRYAYVYYMAIIPVLTPLFELIYMTITLFLLLLFFPMAVKAIGLIRQSKYTVLRPALIIPLCVIVNIIYVMLDSGNFSIVLRDYFMDVASNTNDDKGYYFSQLNTWLGNMAIVLFLAIKIKSKQDIIRCIISSMLVLLIPIIIIIVSNPSSLGTRESSLDNSDINFGGGLWNIGVVGFGSISWLAMALYNQAKKSQRGIILLSVTVFLFVGIAGLSRTLILMVVFSISIYILLSKKNFKLIGRIILIVSTIFLFLVLEGNIVNSIIERFNDSTSGTQNIRFLLWASYLSFMNDYWLIGAPEGSVYNYYFNVDRFGVNFLPHSAVINFFVRYGIFAVLAYFVLIKNSFLSIKKTICNKQNRICVICGGVTYVSLAFINQTGFSESIFYIMFGLNIAYSRILNNESNEQKYITRNKIW